MLIYFSLQRKGFRQRLGTLLFRNWALKAKEVGKEAETRRLVGKERPQQTVDQGERRQLWHTPPRSQRKRKDHKRALVW